MWWCGAAYGHFTSIVVVSHDVRAFVRPVLTDKEMGVALDDQDGNQLTFAVTYIGPPADAEPPVDADALLREIRAMAEGQADLPLAALINRLDQYLTGGGGLPDDWVNSEYGWES